MKSKTIMFGTEAGEVDLNKIWEKKGAELIKSLAHELSTKFELPAGAEWLVNRLQEEADAMITSPPVFEMRANDDILSIQSDANGTTVSFKNGVETNIPGLTEGMSFGVAMEQLKMSPVRASAYRPGLAYLVRFINEEFVLIDTQTGAVSDLRKTIDLDHLAKNDWKICVEVD